MIGNKEGTVTTTKADSSKEDKNRKSRTSVLQSSTSSPTLRKKPSAVAAGQTASEAVNEVEDVGEHLVQKTGDNNNDAVKTKASTKTVKKKPKSPKRSGPVTTNEKQSKANSVKGEPTTEFEKEANEGMGNIKIDEEPDIKELLGNTNG